jgi:pyruvate, orthophosphate dikinase
MVRYVYDLQDGGRDLAGLLGGKGANLAEMTRLGLPVPPGFVVSTEACRTFLATGEEPEGMSAEVSRNLSALETGVGRLLGQGDDPLLVSVRSGARFSMPGMMETVLDIGLNDDSVLGLAKVSGSERFAWDSYRRLVQMYGSTVLGVDPALFDEAMTLLKDAREAPDDLHLFDSAEAVRRAAADEKVVLVREETTPDDLPGMVAAQAVLTGRGGKTSHAAVVARGMGKVCVCGTQDITVNAGARRFTARGGIVVEQGTVISVDGSTGDVYLGPAPLVASATMRYLESGEQADSVVCAVARALDHADSVRRLEVRANADTPEDAARARRFGAQGIGLCRTEHMFLGERRKLVEEMILARTEADRDRALGALLPLQRRDFTGILEAMDGFPVTIRLLDPPLHEFLPDRTDLAVRIATAEATGQQPDAHHVELLAAVNRMHEKNPMLGLRGVRLGLVVPGLVAMQVRAIAEAVVERTGAGGSPYAEIMVPLVGAVEELRLAREEVARVMTEVGEETGTPVHCPVGTMIELPRAALTAGRIAEEAEFFSFGTNDLTQTTWGFSRDDVEAAFFSAYLDKGVFAASPFETLDREGVGRLVRIAVEEGRAARPDLETGVCGEHGGDPESIHFFHEVGLDYVSCSPFRVPVARLEAGRAALADTGTSDSR